MKILPYIFNDIIPPNNSCGFDGISMRQLNSLNDTRVTFVCIVTTDMRQVTVRKQCRGRVVKGVGHLDHVSSYMCGRS